MTAALADRSKSVLFEDATNLRTERTWRLPNRNLNLCHEDLVVKPSGDFGRVGRFKKQRERLDEVGSRFFNRGTLARDIEFRAQRHETVVLTFNDCG